MVSTLILLTLACYQNESNARLSFSDSIETEETMSLGRGNSLSEDSFCAASPNLPNSYTSLMEFIDYAWTLKEIKDKKEIFKQLYKKYSFVESADLSFKETYSFSAYENDLQTVLAQMSRAGFQTGTQNSSDWGSVGGYENLMDKLEYGQEEFIHFAKGDEKEINARIILNLKPPYVLKMPEFIKKNFDVRVKSFKMTSYNYFNKRKDNFIIYVSGLDFAQEYGEKIHAGFLKKYPESFNKVVPYMTNSLADGLAIAEESKLKNHSVGSLRCKIIAEALFDAKDSFDDFKKKVAFSFEENKIDFFIPHKNLEP